MSPRGGKRKGAPKGCSYDPLRSGITNSGMAAGRMSWK